MLSEELIWELLRAVAVIAGMILGFRAGWNMLKDRKKEMKNDKAD